ncbi:MAG: tRNA (adenosine(37)-N6)-threonylcarbamoyltransferase complex ATPase subunit type 1 TsaE [Acidaminococcaceae bacterium]
MKEFYCASSEETEKIGFAIGLAAGEGDIICLSGDLGAGKTALAKGIALAKGVPASDITSPTFAIMNIYKGKDTELKHFDLYRLDSAEELDDIGFDEYVGGCGITMIEWSDLFPEEMPEEHLQINISVEKTGRQVVLQPHGRHYEELCEKVEVLVNSRN